MDKFNMILTANNILLLIVSSGVYGRRILSRFIFFFQSVGRCYQKHDLNYSLSSFVSQFVSLFFWLVSQQKLCQLWRNRTGHELVIISCLPS